jgi:hypothetical protein
MAFGPVLHPCSISFRGTLRNSWLAPG